MMVYSMGILIGAVGMLVTGIVPTTEEIARIFVFLLLTCLYLFLAGAGAAIFCNLQECGNFGNAVHLYLAVFLFVYDNVSQCNRQCTVSSRDKYGSVAKFCKKLFLPAGIKPDFPVLSV